MCIWGLGTLPPVAFKNVYSIYLLILSGSLRLFPYKRWMRDVPSNCLLWLSKYLNLFAY